MALAVSMLHSGLRPCSPWRSNRSPSRKVRPPCCRIRLVAVCTPGRRAACSSARCSHTSRSDQRCTVGDAASAPENLTSTCGVPLAVPGGRLRRAANLGNSPAALEPGTPLATASSASWA